MNFVGKRVKHIKDGLGTITDFYTTSKRFIVRFDNGIERPYQYPDIFGSVLSTDDPEMICQIQIDTKVNNGTVIKRIVGNKVLYGLTDKGNRRAQFADPAKTKYLEKDISYGTNAQDIYISLCNNPAFSWDISKKNSFSIMSHLYSQDCTLDYEKCSVWFVSYSSFNESINETRDIVNNIEDTNDYKNWGISEVWGENAAGPPVEKEGEINITFVKNKSGQYIFWGVLRVKELENQNKPYHVFKEFVSDTYFPGKKY